MGRIRRAEMKLMSMMPGMMAMAMSASRQLSTTRMQIAKTSRMMDTAGDTIAICNRPVVVSMSPVRRDRMPPVFMSHSRGSGKCNRRSNSARRNESITFVFSRRWRLSLYALTRFIATMTMRNSIPAPLRRLTRSAAASPELRSTRSTMYRMKSGSSI